MDKIEKIRQEIERRKSLLTQHSKLTYDLILETFIKEYDDLLSFLDTLSEEPDKNLEEAAEAHFETMDVLEYENIFEETHREIFKAGAEWQAKQGYSSEYIIKYAWGVSDTSTEPKKATLSFPLPAYIFEGDRVIIQIRKK